MRKDICVRDLALWKCICNIDLIWGYAFYKYIQKFLQVNTTYVVVQLTGCIVII